MHVLHLCMRFRIERVDTEDLMVRCHYKQWHCLGPNSCECVFALAGHTVAQWAQSGGVGGAARSSHFCHGLLRTLQGPSRTGSAGGKVWGEREGKHLLCVRCNRGPMMSPIRG